MRTMKASIACGDRYEAQKMAGLILVRKGGDGGSGGGGSGSGGETYVTSVLNVIGNEVVISLKDGSAHSILLRDEASVEAFADFLQSVVEGEHRLVSARAVRDGAGEATVVEIVKG